jgi:hypothetical protein
MPPCWDPHGGVFWLVRRLWLGRWGGLGLDLAGHDIECKLEFVGVVAIASVVMLGDELKGQRLPTYDGEVLGRWCRVLMFGWMVRVSRVFDRVAVLPDRWWGLGAWGDGGGLWPVQQYGILCGVRI